MASLTTPSQITWASQHQHDLWLLEETFQIGRYIQTVVDTQTQRQFSNDDQYFGSGPNSFYGQTKTGLILNTSCGQPDTIDTPFGRWIILGQNDSSNKVMEAITQPLGLKLINTWGYELGPNASRHEVMIPSNANFPITAQSFAITQWNGQPIEDAQYRNENERVSDATVQQVWNTFRSFHAFQEYP